MRIALNNARIMVHQPSGGAQGMALAIEIQASEKSCACAHALNTLYAKYTGQDIEAIELAMDRDKFLEADEAKEFGLIDEVRLIAAPMRAKGIRPARGGRHSGLTGASHSPSRSLAVSNEWG